MFRADGHEGITHDVHLDVAKSAHRVRQDRKEITGILGVVHDVVGSFAGEDGYRAVRGFQAGVGVQRLPRVDVLVLSDAIGVGAGVAECRLVRLAGDGPAQIDQGQLHGPADSGIGPPAGAEAVVAAIDVEFFDYGTTDNHEGRVYASGAHHPAKVEPVVHHGLDGGNDHGHILGQATGHHSVHGDSFHGRFSAQRRQFGDDL